MTRKIIQPKHVLLEKVAGALAATWFEAAANTPLMNLERHKYNNDPRKFAKQNLEKFIPQALDILIGMLGRPDIAMELKEEIYDMLQDRINDPTNITSADFTGLPDIDAKKLVELGTTQTEKVINQFMKPEREKPLEITAPKTDTRPFRAIRH